MSPKWPGPDLVSRLKDIATSRLALVVTVVVLASAGSVFAGTQLQDDRTASDPLEDVQPDGSLRVDPAPLTLSDVAKARKGSATRAVLRLWYFAQWGSPPNVLDAYAPRVITRLGAKNVASAYSSLRASLLGMRPKILDEVRGRAGTVVTLEGLRRNAKPARYSFTLVRTRGGRWQVVFDTLLEDAIAAAVQAANSPDPNSKPPGSAVRKGLVAASDFRAAQLEGRYASKPRRVGQVGQSAGVR